MSLNLHSPSVRYPLGVVALVLAVFALRIAAEALVTGFVEGRSWLPTVGTVGQTVSLLLLAVNVVAFLVVPAAAFYLGHRHGRATA
ncbi:hypothetical protein [Halorarius litoreus]|uniref:hypothetical protein n=1 Tax=Halorarius litoreus TaxID=2962676 RepID=UPI0020CEFB10|nr:hypothetical protein [Halorarius litoreus]